MKQLKTANVLEEANTLIYGERQKEYGSARKSFTKIAKGWQQIFDCDVSPKQVALAMIWLKMCREMNQEKRDNIVDIAGYAGCIDKINKNE
jgi:hypothetical protein